MLKQLDIIQSCPGFFTMLHSSNEITVYMAFFISLNITSTSSPPATSLKDIMEQEQNKESPDIRTTSEVGTS